MGLISFNTGLLMALGERLHLDGVKCSRALGVNCENLRSKSIHSLAEGAPVISSARLFGEADS